MVRLAFGLVDTPEAAEEITQDAFAKVFERWSRLQNPGGYLRTAVVNGARSELRKREVRRRIRLGRPQGAAAEQDYLLDALERLPTRRKTALVLRYYGDLSRTGDRRGHGHTPRHGQEPAVGRGWLNCGR